MLAIVLEAVVRIGRRALRNGALRRASRPSPSSRSSSFGVPFPLIVLAAALIGFLGGAGRARRLPARRRPRRRRRHRTSPTPRRSSARSCRRTPGRGVGAARCACRRIWAARSGWCRWRSSCCLAGPGNVFTEIATFFSRMAVVTFGGAYAVLAYVAQEAVEHLRLARPGRDARRPRHGRDHARAR